MAWQARNQDETDDTQQGTALPVPTAPTPADQENSRLLAGGGGPIRGGGAGVYAPELNPQPAAPQPPTGEVIPSGPSEVGGVSGGNIAAGNAEEAAPGGGGITPTGRILGSSAGGSMVRTVGPTGVEEIKGTGRPSWQLYQGAGQTAQYPAAVAAWRSGLSHQAGEERKALIQAQSHVDAATLAATREGPGATQERGMKAKVFEEAQKEKARALQAQTEKDNVARYNEELHGSPYSTFEPGKGHTFTPTTPELSLDSKAGENWARTNGWQAGLQHMDERQMARKYLTTQPLQPNTDINALLTETAKNPIAWGELMKRAQTSGVVGGPPPPKPPWYSRSLGIFGRNEAKVGGQPRALPEGTPDYNNPGTAY